MPNHNDLDGGTFVFEAGGRRWAVDLGSDSYQLPNYFVQDVGNRTRYNLYRKATVGHNTLVFDADVARPCMQVANGCADAAVGACSQLHTRAGIGNISLFESGGRGGSPGYAIVNLTAAYAGAARVERGFAFTEGYEQLVVADEIEFAAAAAAAGGGFRNVSWSMHTAASIAFVRSGGVARTAVLRQGGDALYVSVLEPAGAVMRAVPVQLAPPQRASPGVRKLVLEATRSQLGAAGRIVVSLSLVKGRQGGGGGGGLRVNALAEWGGAGPFGS